VATAHNAGGAIWEGGKKRYCSEGKKKRGEKNPGHLWKRAEVRVGVGKKRRRQNNCAGWEAAKDRGSGDVSGGKTLFEEWKKGGKGSSGAKEQKAKKPGQKRRVPLWSVKI